MNTKRGAIYARYSTDLQNDRSVEDQIALCRSYADRNGINVVSIFHDRARSGASVFGRDGLLSLIEASKSGIFNTVIVEALDQAEKGSAETERLHQAWHRGDAEGLWSGMAADMKRQYPRLYRRINVERNDAWVPRIQQILTQPGDDDALVVVGALHLLGDDGVVEKLRARGYQVERICSACKAGTR